MRTIIGAILIFAGIGLFLWIAVVCCNEFIEIDDGSDREDDE